MAARKRIVKKVPDFRLTRTKDESEREEDLKQVKSTVLKTLDDNKKNEKEWYDNELDKNLKKQ